MIGVKDTYSAMKKAFGPLYKAISEINRQHMYVSVPWAPQLPTSAKFELSGDAEATMVSCDVDLYLNMFD